MIKVKLCRNTSIQHHMREPAGEEPFTRKTGSTKTDSSGLGENRSIQWNL